jgi:hypothetical protein
MIRCKRMKRTGRKLSASPGSWFRPENDQRQEDEENRKRMISLTWQQAQARG